MTAPAVRGLVAVAAVLLALAGGCAPVPADDLSAQLPAEATSVLPAAAEVGIPPPHLRASSVARVARQLTVRVRARGCGRIGTASGVAVAPHLLVTNRHVVEGADELELNYWDGTSTRARLQRLAVADDLALVEVSLRLPAVAAIASSDAPERAEVIVVGYPKGEEQTVERGEIVEYARLREPSGASPVIRMTTAIVPGNSGGAVVDGSGELVGIVFGVETETGFGLAIPVSAVRALLAEGGRSPSSGCP